LSIRSLRSAVAFLTVVPVAGEDGTPGERLGRAYFPAVGALLGLAAGVALVVVSAATSALVGAVAAVAVLAILTGGLHLDGLADAADGLLSPKAGVGRLEIMRDSRIGSFGAAALILVLVGDVAALAGLSPARAVAAVGGIEAAADGLRSLMEGRFAGKIVIFPQLRGLPLTSLEDLAIKDPELAAALGPSGTWTSEAEAVLFAKHLEPAAIAST